MTDFAESHLLSIVEACQGKPWQMTVKLPYGDFFKSPMRSEARVERVSHLLYNIYYKNATIRILNDLTVMLD
jgi:hypothetical protein